jgi:predicted acylesterase/phospholipase RssA
MEWLDDLNLPTDPKWALLLSGGSALGAVQVPVINGLVRALGLPSTVCGTSVGAVHALLVGEGRTKALLPIWKDVAEEGSKWFMRLNFDAWNGMFTLKPLRRQVEAREAGKELKLDTRVGVVDLADSEHRMICLNNWGWPDRVDAALCSAAQPFIHEKEMFRGRWLNDGGVDHLMPTLPDHAEYDFVAAVFCSPVGDDRDRPRRPQARINSAVEQAFASVDMMTDRVAQDDYKRMRRWKKPTRAIFAPRSWDRVGESFDASAEIIERRLDEGRWMRKNPVFKAQ